MAKSKHISGLLLLALVCVHFGIAGNIIEESKEQRAKSKDFHQTQSESRETGIRNQEPGAKSKDFSRVSMGGGGFKEISRGDRVAVVKKIYDSQVGVRERGSNSGPQVEKYLHYVGLAKGQAWCTAFVCWVFGQAGIANPRRGWSPDLFPASKIIWEREHGTVREPGTRNQEQGLPQSAIREQRAKIKEQGLPPNVQYVYPYLPAEASAKEGLATPTTTDVFGLYFPEKKRIAHVGFIDQWGDKWVITVEGNTNESGAREGDGVYSKRRPIRSIYRVARYIK